MSMLSLTIFVWMGTQVSRSKHSQMSLSRVWSEATRLDFDPFIYRTNVPRLSSRLKQTLSACPILLLHLIKKKVNRKKSNRDDIERERT